MAREAVNGSAPDHTGYRAVGAADPAMSVRVSIVLRPRDSGVAAELLSGRYDPARRDSGGAEDGAIAAVEAFTRGTGLKIVETNAPARTVIVTGSAEQMNHAFGVHLALFEAADGARYLSHEGSVTLPSEIAPSVLAVLGLDTRPAAQPR